MRTDDLMTLPAGLPVHVFYRVFPSDRDGAQVLDWLRA
jgi:hypothetical protein